MADDANISPNIADGLETTALDESGELTQTRDRWMRAEAEIANVRSRAQRDVEEARQFAVQAFAKDVVETAENLQRGIASLPAQTERESEIVTRVRDGFGGIERSFVSMLERHGVVRTDPTGAAFDANLHQAMDQQISADHPPGTVLQAWTSGLDAQRAPVASGDGRGVVGVSRPGTNKATAAVLRSRRIIPGRTDASSGQRAGPRQNLGISP